MNRTLEMGLFLLNVIVIVNFMCQIHWVILRVAETVFLEEINI